MSLRGAQRRGNPSPPLVIASIEDAWQSVPPCHCEPVRTLVRQSVPFVLTGVFTDSHDQFVNWSRNDILLCHCEERSDAAIRSRLLSLRASKMRGNPFPSPSQGYLRIPTTSLRTGLGMTDNFVIARSAATRQSVPPCHCEHRRCAAIRSPRPHGVFTDSHDQFENWSRNDR